MRRTILPCALLLVAVPLFGAVKYPVIMDSWSSGTATSYRKVIIVAITNDLEARKHFENKFVSHMRSRNIEAVTSRSMVPDLHNVEDREKLLAEIEAQSIDAVFHVRLVSLKDRTEEEWGAAWKASLGPDLTLRQVVESDPIDMKKTKLFGVEIGVWSIEEQALVFAARTDPYKRKELDGAGGAFAEIVLNMLEDLQLLRR